MSTVPVRALRRSWRWAIPWLALLGLAGCTATITSDELLSRPLSAPTDGRRPLTGSINVNVTLDMESIYISRPRELVWPDLLAGYLRLRREALWEAMRSERYEIGIVNPRFLNNVVEFPKSGTAIRGHDFESARLRSVQTAAEPLAWDRDDARLYGSVMREALEKTIVRDGLATSVNRGQADYVLDVWIDRITGQRPTAGLGAFASDVLSTWRLTRASDGKVLACDFVRVRGTIASMGAEPSKRAFFDAMRRSIDQGLAVVFDGTREHLAALVPAGMSRPSMGKAAPAGADLWRERIRQGWPKLRRGMTIGEVEVAVGRIAIHPELEYRYVVPVQFASKGSLPHFGSLDFAEYRTGVYALIFMDERSDPARAPDPRLLIWELL